MLCNVLEKYHLFPGSTLLLGSLCQYVSTKYSYTLGAGIVASSTLVRQRGEGCILDDIGLFGANGMSPCIQGIYVLPNTLELLSYLTELLESPE